MLYRPPARRHYHRQWSNHDTALAKLQTVESELDALIAMVEGSAMEELQACGNILDQGLSDLCLRLLSMKMELELVDAVRKRIFGDVASVE